MDLLHESSLAANTAILGPLNLSGYGDEGALEYAPTSEDDVEVVAGYDGGVVANHILDDSVILTISVRETSRTYRELGALLQLQRAARSRGQAVPRYPWRHIDALNGDEVNVAATIFVGGPGLTKTNRFSNRPFKLLLPNAKLSFRYGLLNL